MARTGTEFRPEALQKVKFAIEPDTIALARGTCYGKWFCIGEWLFYGIESG